MSICFTPVLGEVIRLTRVDDCGRIIVGDPCPSVVSEGFITVTMTAETDEGTDIIVRNAKDEICVNRQGRTDYIGRTVSVEFCEVDVDLLELATNSVPVLDFEGESVGYELLEGHGGNYALEVWTGTEGLACPEDPADGTPRGYYLLPWIEAGAPGDVEITNSNVTFTVNGTTRKGGGWGVGPYDVVASDALNTPGPLLVPVDADAHDHFEITTIDPPVAGCGCTTESPAA